MVKMTFVRTIKYNGVIYTSNSPVEVQDKDIASLKKIGGFVIAEDAVAAEAKKSEAEAEAAVEEKTPPTRKRKKDR